MEVNRWDSWSLHCLLLVRSFLLVAQGEGIYLAEKTKVVWSEAETLFHALVGRGPLRSGKRLEKKWNSYDVTLPTLQEQLSCWIVNGSFSEESKAFAYVAHCLESLKGQTLPNRWAKWCVQYNLGAGPFVFLYRVIHQVGAFCCCYVCITITMCNSHSFTTCYRSKRWSKSPIRALVWT